MQRNSIQLSPKSVPRQLQEDSDNINYDSQFASTSRCYPETLRASSDIRHVSSEIYPLDHLHSQSEEECRERETSQTCSKSQNRNNDILSRIWSPCSAGCSIGEQLDFIEFPVSYRDLVYRWIALDRPQLEFLSTPLSMQPTLIVQDLQQLCESQEASIIDSITSYFEKGKTTRVNSFIDFASHVDVYSAVNAELVCLEDKLEKDSKNISRLYEEIWWNTLQAFDFDRSTCTANISHNCFRYLLLGEVYDWQLEDIIDKFQIYKNRSSIIKPILMKQFKRDISGLLNSSSAPCLITGSLNDGETKVPSPSLSTHMSTLGLTDFVSASVEADSFSTPLSLDGFTSYWQNDRNSEANYDTPSAQSTSTPGGRSPFRQNHPIEQATITQSTATLLQSDITWDNTMGFTQAAFDQFNGNMNISPIPPFELLPSLQDSTTNTPSIKSSFSDVKFDWRVSTPVSQSIIEYNNHYNNDEVTYAIPSTNSTFSTPATPATGFPTIPSSCPHRNKRQASSQWQEEVGAENDMDVRKILRDLNNFTKQGNGEDDTDHLFNFLKTRRDSSSSIGSSFGSENALEKVEEYRKLLQKAASQLGTAARLLGVRAGKLHSSQDFYGQIPCSPPITSTNTSPAAVHASSNTSKRARLVKEGKSQRPFRPRSQTTS